MRLRIVLLLLLLTFIGTGCGLLREPEEASQPIEAVPLDVATTAPTEPAESVEPTEPTEPAESVEPVEPTEPAEPAGQLRIYQIAPGDSQVRFELDEDLRGQRNTVIGATDQVAGEIAVDLNDLTTAQVGVIQINARTLLTDNNFRNRAIQNEILDTGAYEFITFTPTTVTGLPGNAAVGQEVTFTVSGDLTIRDISQPVSFTVTATVVSADQLAGTAEATVQRGDYNLTIPSVPNVANVEEEVQLFIDFVANAQ